jgi:hypothetical protein
LFKARKHPLFEDLFRHVNPLEQIIELLRSASRVPSASDSGEMFAIFSKVTLCPGLLSHCGEPHEVTGVPD